ncbi:MAG: primosomal protein N', partial [Gemmatimonadota bacterium]|nr:primosomal protein N' [Gemmatimonadota bacterium]
VVSGAMADEVAAAAERVADRLREERAPGLEVIGPAPCPLERLRGRARHHVLLKADRPGVLGRTLWELAREEEALVGTGNRLEIDRDPLDLL